MSSSKTEHLQLHRWESGDEFRREEFNENFSKVDAGVKAAETRAATVLDAYKNANDKALADGLSAQTAALNAYKGVNDAAVAALAGRTPKLAVGSYVGTGVNTTITLTFEFAPKFLLVYTGGNYFEVLFGVPGQEGLFAYRNGSGTSATSGDGIYFGSEQMEAAGSTVSFWGGTKYLNQKLTYHYFAVG